MHPGFGHTKGNRTSALHIGLLIVREFAPKGKTSGMQDFRTTDGKTTKGAREGWEAVPRTADSPTRSCKKASRYRKVSAAGHAQTNPLGNKTRDAHYRLKPEKT